MSKHTPGPWTYKKLDHPENVTVISEIRGKDNKFVVAYPFSTVEDALLIAAALELLAALIELLPIATGAFDAEWDEIEKLPIIVMARAAIAKATGK